MDSFTARTPVDLLAIVPFVIGFHPEDSVVMLTFGEAGRTGRPQASFHARVDLPAAHEGQRQTARLLHEVAVRHGAGLVGVILYTDDTAAAEHFADLILPALLGDGIDVIDVLRVDEGRYFSVGEPEDPGTPYDLASHAFTASQVLQGRVALESREALRATLVGHDDQEPAAIAAAATTVVDALIAAAGEGAVLSTVMLEHARWVQRTVRAAVGGAAELAAADAGRMLVLVSFEALREVAWSEMSRTDARQHVELWRDLVRRAPDNLRSAAAALLGFAAWLAGDGALAWCALERCFEGDPDDQLGQHVAALVESATPPTVWSAAPAETLRIFQVAEAVANS